VSFKLKETIFKDNGNTSITEKPFESKAQILKQIKRYLAIPSAVIYALNIYDETEFIYNGTKRKFEIIQE
jgi:hypothetical protein